ncbi:MAG TPA: cation diffusion facilitator family transporter [Bacteroidia bacterium]|nr:cation diffusion facilitator family transporter [Bacteroidia bacterium]HRU68063.1 cation diffusion facilitator family transporter [Bacteroidia bacterium]
MKDKNRKIALLEGWLSTVVNTFLFAIKLWAGIMTGSIAIIADAWHTLSDSLTSVIVIIGVKVSSKPADKEHPFGHGRAELIASLIIGVLLAVVAANFASESIKRLIRHEEVIFNTLSIVVMIVSVVVKEAIAQYAFYAARITKMDFLKADGWHHRSDSIASVLILIGIIFQKKAFWIDGVLGLIVSVLILLVAVKVIRDAVNCLLGKDITEETKMQIVNIVDETSFHQMHPHHFHYHEYGRHQEVTFHIRLPAEMTVSEAHDIAKKIEVSIEERLNIQATIHIDPV